MDGATGCSFLGPHNSTLCRLVETRPGLPDVQPASHERIGIWRNDANAGIALVPLPEDGVRDRRSDAGLGHLGPAHACRGPVLSPGLCDCYDQASQEQTRNDSDKRHDREPLKPTRHRSVFEPHHRHSLFSRIVQNRACGRSPLRRFAARAPSN